MGSRLRLLVAANRNAYHIQPEIRVLGSGSRSPTVDRMGENHGYFGNSYRRGSAAPEKTQPAIPRRTHFLRSLFDRGGCDQPSIPGAFRDHTRGFSRRPFVSDDPRARAFLLPD